MSIAETYPLRESRLPPDLDALTQSAYQRNVFFEPAVLEPALRYLAPENAQVLTAMAPESNIPQAAMPVQRMGGRYGPLPTLSPLGVWHHPYSMVGTPLIAAKDPHAAMAALFDEAQAMGPPTVLLLPFVPADDAFWPVFSEVCAATKRRYTRLVTHQRAGLRLSLAETRNASPRSLLGKKVLQSIKASQRKLSVFGDLATITARDGEALIEAVEVFLALEAAGWKGQQGTSLRTAGHGAFVREVTGNLSLKERIRIDITTITKSGNPTTLAATMSLRAGSDEEPVWMPWKTAYNEAYQAAGPGALSLARLTLDLLEETQAKDEPLLLDSLADEHSVVANRLWHDRWMFHDVLIDLTPGGSRGYDAIVLAEKARLRARASAKAARDSVKKALRRARSV